MTMKRLIALALSLILTLTAGSALAEDMTLWKKLTKQTHDSAYRGTVTFEASGEGTQAFEPSTWLIIRSLASRLKIEATHTMTIRTGVGEAMLTMSLDDQPLARADYRYNKQLMGLSSSLLAGDDVFYTADRSWDAFQLLETAFRGEDAWPPVWKMLLEMESAPEAWKTRLKAKLLPYETKLGVWLNGYAVFSTGEIEEVKYTELSCAIPFRAVKTEIQQLLVDFYNDAELLSILREVVTPQEAAAYLQPGMMSTFIAMLDALDIEGDVEVVRRYSSQGKLMLDMMTLPFLPDSLVTSLTITLRPDEYGDVWGLTGTTGFGADFDVSCVIGEERIYTGSVDLILPPEASDETAFVVIDGTEEAEEPERKTVAFDYSLAFDPGKDAYSIAANKYMREITGTLLIRPRGMEGMPTQSLALNCTLESNNLDIQSVTRLNGTLTWHDLDSGADITATLESRTTAPFAYNTLDNVVGMRVDQMTADSLNTVIQYLGENLKANFAALVNRLATSIFSFATPVQ